MGMLIAIIIDRGNNLWANLYFIFKRSNSNVKPAITATLYSDHLHIAATFNRYLQDLPYYNLLYLTAIFAQSFGWPLLAGSTVCGYILNLLSCAEYGIMTSLR